jgi:hypothetical protein
MKHSPKKVNPHEAKRLYKSVTKPKKAVRIEEVPGYE